MYVCIKTCVRSNKDLSDSFDTYMGLKKCEPLCLLPFIFYANDMYDYVRGTGVPCLTVDDIQFFITFCR